MEKAFLPPIASDWKALYRAAICESDKSAFRRIVEAEKAILARERELFYSGGTLQEKEALEDALHALHALRKTCRSVEAA